VGVGDNRTHQAAAAVARLAAALCLLGQACGQRTADRDQLPSPDARTELPAETADSPILGPRCLGPVVRWKRTLQFDPVQVSQDVTVSPLFVDSRVLPCV
jgi:hypothetical protein